MSSSGWAGILNARAYIEREREAEVRSQADERFERDEAGQDEPPGKPADP